MSGSKPYPQELRERAAITAVAAKPGVGTAETLRKWMRQAQVDAGTRTGVSTEESAELRRLRRENAELKRANEILKAASAFFAAELCATRRRVDRGRVRDRPRWVVAAAW